jgi:hypothetical protein
MWQQPPPEEDEPPPRGQLSSWVQPPRVITCPVCHATDIRVRTRDGHWEFWCTACDCQGPAEMVAEEGGKRTIRPMEE